MLYKERGGGEVEGEAHRVNYRGEEHAARDMEGSHLWTASRSSRHTG